MRYVIWESYPEFDDESREWLHNEHPSFSDSELEDVFYGGNSDELYFIREELSIQLGHPIFVIADLGLWNGRRQGYKEISSGNIADCLYAEGDNTVWYVDEYGDLRCDDTHHDGTNHYLYREWLGGVSEKDKEAFLEKIYNGQPSFRCELERVTRAIGWDIAELYGWEIPPIDRDIETNVGKVPIADYREIIAIQNGFDSYTDMYRQGYRIADGNDWTPQEAKKYLRETVKDGDAR